MKVVIQNSVARESLRKSVPKRYHGWLSNLPRAERYTLVIFPPEKTIESAHAKKVLDRVAGNLPLLVFGHEFTEESMGTIQKQGGFVFGESYFGWTDESHRRSRELMGSHRHCAGYRMKQPSVQNLDVPVSSGLSGLINDDTV